jgi:HD-GYP domain-containing protein (c-di-GMP phosphodiesterase class II)
VGSVAGCHHERLDGSGYHRGLPGAGLGMPARLLAAADAYCTKTEPRPHRAALSPGESAVHLRFEAGAGRLDPDGVAVVLGAAGHQPGDVKRPDGLSAREGQTLTLLARGRATKQIARELGVTPKTADHYVQRVYHKIGVSSRAAAAVYAMQHGFTTWENTHS